MHAPKRTEAATNERLRRAAVRALDDPAKLNWAARIIREALARNQMTLADLAPEQVEQLRQIPGVVA